ncbi:MAG: ABC transporter ATP-binding protein [Candidatus Eisenbacteria bacterium]|nr:ABC transporter ATP-binding protein [Candidatus Eisenbacteria bacterium]
MTNGNEIALSVRDLSKRFRKTRSARGHTTLKSILLRRSAPRPAPVYTEALRGVTFEVPRGAAWGIIGPNGSGKSTLLKLITGIYRPDRGDVHVRGKLASLIELGAGFHPEFSGRENVILNGIVLGMSKREIQNRFDDIVAFSELEDFIDEPVRTYSTGMYMRLAFSIAVHVDPDVLLMDEILSVGDESFVRKCRRKIQDFRDKRKTMLIVSHDLAAVERVCDHALLFEHGRIVERGEPAEVIRRYRSHVNGEGGEGVAVGRGETGAEK